MAITKKYVNEMLGTVLVLAAVLSTASAVDCNGKSFHCVNSTHFMICVDLGGGVSQAIDNFFIACPPPTVCRGTNQFECEFPAPTTPATTPNNGISETSLPWEEVVTASSSGNATKEFSENYMNTEKITSTAEYSVTTDATVDLTAIDASEFNVHNELNTTEIKSTLAAEIATTAIETNQTVNENVNATEYVPTVVAEDITTAVENVTQTTTESKNLTETEPLVFDDITTTAVETTTENIIEIEYIAPSGTKQVAQTINENMNITETVPMGLENVTQTMNETKNIPETGPVVVDDITATALETTTDNIIITDTIAAEIDYIEPTATEHVKQTTNDKLLELETVQSNTEPPQVTILFQNVSVTNNTLLKKPSTEHKFPLTKVEPNSNSAFNITISNLNKDTDLTKTEKSDSAVQNNLWVQTTATVNTFVETTTDNVENLTTISNDRTTDDYTTVSSLDNKFKEHFKSKRVNASEPSKPLISFEGSVRTNASIVINKQSAANQIENKDIQMPTINDPVVPNNIVASRNRTQEVKNIIDARVVGSSINSTTSLHEKIFPEVTVTTDVSPMYAHDAKEIVLHTSTNKSLHENNYTTVSDATNTLNPADTTVLGATETVDNGASTEQPTSLIEEILTTDTTKEFVTENIIPPSQAVTLETINTDTLLTTVSNAQPMPPAFDDNMKLEIPLPVTENIVSTVNNGASTIGLITVQSVNMDTVTTEAVDIPTTISNNQQMSPDFEEVMKAEPSLGNGAPATEDKVTTVNNKLDTNIFMTPQALDLDIITTDAMFMPTTVSYGQALAFEDITTGKKLATENILSPVNNGASTTSHPVNAGNINTEAIYISNITSNAQPIAPTFEDNITTDVPLSTTENILSSVNNGASTNGLVTAQAVNVDTINTNAMYILTTITSAPPLAPAFEDNMNTYVPLPATVNVVSSVNNGVSTNGLTTTQAVNVDSINAEAIYISTTISNGQPIPPTFEENITTNVLLAEIENILTSVNNGTDRDGLTTAQVVNVNSINVEAIPTTIPDASTVEPAFEENITTKDSLAATENILMSVNNGTDRHGLTTAQAIDVGSINVEDIPTTIPDASTVEPAFEENITTKDSLAATENILTSVNNGTDRDGLTTAQAVNVGSINVETIPTTIPNTSTVEPAFEENITTKDSLAATENILTSVNNGTDRDGLTTAQAVNVGSINVETIPTTIPNASTVVPAFEENITTKVSLAATENILSSENNGTDRDGITTTQAVNIDSINAEAIFISSTISDAQPIPPNFEENTTTIVSLAEIENILTSVNNGTNRNGFTTAQAVNVGNINVEAIPTTIPNASTVVPAFVENITTKISLAATENILSLKNNGTDRDGLTTAQAVNVDNINVKAIPTTIPNASTVVPTFEENITTKVSLAATENILTSVNNGTDRDGLTTAQAVNVDGINVEAIPTTISNASTAVPAFKENITIKVSLAATENILSSENNETDTKGLTTAQAVNVHSISTDTTYIPITITNATPMAPAFEDNNMMTDVPLHANENMLSSVNNGASTNGFMTTQAVNVDTDTMYITTTINKAPPLAPTFGDNTRTETTLSAPKNIIFPKNNENSTNGFMIANPMDLEQITQKAGLETIVQLTPDNYVAPSKNVVVNNEKVTSLVYGDIPTKESGASVPVIMKESPNTIIQKTQIILNSSTDTGVKLDAIDSDVNGNYNDNQMTTIDTNKMYEIGEQYIINNILHSTVDSGVDESISHVAQTGARNTENTLFPNAQNNQNEFMSAINEVTANVKPTAGNVNEQAPVNNVAFSQTGASPTSINNNIAKATTTKSIPTSGFDSAFDISNQNWTSQQGDSKATNYLQPSIVEHNDQADNVIWNPLANQVFNNPNQNPESIGTSSVTNINDNTNDSNAASLYTKFVSQQTTTSSVNTGGPIYANIYDREQSIESNTTQSPIDIKGWNDILATNGHFENIAKVNSEPGTVNKLNSQSEIPVTKDSFNLKAVNFATAEIDVSSVPTTLPAKTSGADITMRDIIKNTYKPNDNSLNPPSASTVVETDINSPRKSESNAVISLDNQENWKVKSPQDPSIASISITSDIKPEVKSSAIKDSNSDSPTFVHNNLPSQPITTQFELPTNTHSFSEATIIRTPMEGNKVIKEDDTISKTVMLDLLPLPINNIKFSAQTTIKPVLMDLKSNSQAENTVIITESYKSETLKPIFAETGIQDSGNGGDITTVPRIRDPAFSFPIGITDRTTDTTIVPAVAVSTSNSLTSDIPKTVLSATFNSQTLVTAGTDVSSQPSQHVEKISKKMADAPKNANIIPGPKPSGNGIITNNSDNVHSPNSSNDVNTGIITPESVSKSIYESSKSENIMPHDPIIGNQNSNTTVVTDLNFASQNSSFSTEKLPPNSIGSDQMQTQQSNPSTKNTSISSIFTPAQKISTSTARPPSQMATSNLISHINNNLTKQVPTVAAQTFSCTYGIRGRYSDKGDCRKFYICIGNNEPIVGYCPENTVFSDLKKLCTKNMSHCIRENQFKCPSVGRFSDFMKDNVYYICVNHKNNLYRFKFQCQNGYILDKTTVKCIETKEIESNESVSISSDNSSQTSSAITSSTSSKSISKSRSTSKNSIRAHDNSSKNDNSSKSKKSNEAEETSGKSEGKDDDEDDEVFKCKKEGKFPIRNECRRYYLCKKNRRSEYRRKIKKCDSDQVFHKNKKKCVDDDSYEC